MDKVMDALLESLGSQALAANDRIIQSIADFVEQTVEEFGTASDFIGHISRGDFIVITRPENSEAMTQELYTRFDQEILKLYPSIIQPACLIRLSITTLDGTRGPFANAGEITARVQEMV